MVGWVTLGKTYAQSSAYFHSGAQERDLQQFAKREYICTLVNL
jgi:hypothetical protein